MYTVIGLTNIFAGSQWLECLCTINMTLNHSKWTLVHYSFEVIVVYCTASIELREETSFSLEQWNSV